MTERHKAFRAVLFSLQIANYFNIGSYPRSLAHDQCLPWYFDRFLGSFGQLSVGLDKRIALATCGLHFLQLFLHDGDFSISNLAVLVSIAGEIVGQGCDGDRGESSHQTVMGIQPFNWSSDASRNKLSGFLC